METVGQTLSSYAYDVFRILRAHLRAHPHAHAVDWKTVRENARDDVWYGWNNFLSHNTTAAMILRKMKT